MVCVMGILPVTSSLCKLSSLSFGLTPEYSCPRSSHPKSEADPAEWDGLPTTYL